MPVDPLIFASQELPISRDDASTLESDLVSVMGANRVVEWRPPVQLVAPDTYDVELPHGLPHAPFIIRATILTSYYGVGYERGYWPDIAATIEFLRHRLPVARIWYGRDDGDWVKEITYESMNSFWQHWAVNGHRPYDDKSRTNSVSE